MSFTEDEKTHIREYCGYPPYGSGTEGFRGWRFHQARGLIEYRMTRMSGTEEIVVRQYLATLGEMVEQIDSGDPSNKMLGKFDDWRRRLCGFLGVPPGPGLQSVERGA